jgi:uncharacterized protein YceH (UPF0502 family)
MEPHSPAPHSAEGIAAEPLHPVEIRVLGALLEKEITTPEYYPLTLNALVNACNQKSSRDPVVNYEEEVVQQALALLRHKGLAVRISGAGHRVEKYAHSLGERLNLGRRESAVLCVLMLRGPQTAGELRGRTERMHEFAEIADVEHCLEALAARTPEPLVAPMPRGRWCHLLGGVPDPARASAEAPASGAAASNFEERIAALEREVAELKQTLESFRRQFE